MYKNDKKIFVTLFFSIFATITGVGIVVPLLPVYAHDLGAGGFVIGLIFGAYSFSRTLFLPYFGRLSDKKGRRPFIVIGMLLYALMSIAFLLSHTVTALVITRFFHGIASAMIMPVAQAYVGDITPKGREGFIMGLFNMSMFIGLSAGPLLGGVIHDHLGLHMAYICMGVLALVGFGLSFFLLPATSAEKVNTRPGAQLSWRLLLANHTVAGLFCFRFAYTACIGMIWAFLPILADAEFSVSSSMIGFLVMLGVCIGGIIQAPMGYLADRINKPLMVIIGGILITLAVLAYQQVGGIRDMITAGIIFGIGGGISMPALLAMSVIIGNRIGAMGSIMGILTMGHSLGMVCGSFFAGIMMDIFDLRRAFLAAALIMLICTVLFMVLTLKGAPDTRTPNPEPKPK